MSEPAVINPIPPLRFNMRPYWRTLIPILLVALVPPLLIYIASAVAELNGCTIVETGPTACIVMGADLGRALYTLASLVELVVIAFPIACLCFFLWLFVLIINVMSWRRKQGAYAKGVVLTDATKLNVNLVWYGVTLVPIVAVFLATVSGWLPAPVLFVVIFVAIFWAFSFIVAIIVKIGELRGRKK